MNCKRCCGPHLHCTPSRAGKHTWKLAPWNVNRSFQHSVKSKFFVNKEWRSGLGHGKNTSRAILLFPAILYRLSLCAEGTAEDSLTGFPSYLILEIFVKSFPPIVLPFRWNIHCGHCRWPIRICSRISDWLLENEMFSTKARLNETDVSSTAWTCIREFDSFSGTWRKRTLFLRFAAPGNSDIGVSIIPLEKQK